MVTTPISDLDFSSIKNNLKTFLEGQSQFQDYDYEGSNMSVILDVLAYNTFMNNFYSNMAVGEMFLDSAQLRTSIVSHAKELNYLPRSYKASVAQLELTFTPGDSPAFITVPKYTKFTTTFDGISYTFSTDQTYTLIPDGASYVLSDVDVYEGALETEYFDVTNTSRYTLSNKQLDTDSIVVTVYESDQVGAESTTYTYSSNIFGLGPTDTPFYLQPAEKEVYEIAFGGDVFGREPTAGEIIEVKYRVSSGEDPNGATSFTPNDQISGYTATVVLETAAAGGAEQEDLESIKFYAPKSIQIQERAVVESDYENLLKNRFSEIQAVSVYGGEEASPPLYGKVIVAVDVQNADGVSENNKTKFTTFLSERCPLAIEPVIISPEFMYTDVSSIVVFDSKVTNSGEGDIESIVRNALQTYSDTYLNDFRKDVRVSRVSRAIDDSDDSIVSNDTKLKMIVDTIPTLNTDSSFSIDFQNQLVEDHPISLSEDPTVHDPAVKSSNFTYNGTTSFLQDDGQGTMQIVTITSDGFKVLVPDTGDVSYEDGIVIIRNLNVSAFSGQAVKIIAKPEVQDIIGPKQRISSIRAEDVNVTVSVLETNA